MRRRFKRARNFWLPTLIQDEPFSVAVPPVNGRVIDARAILNNADLPGTEAGLSAAVLGGGSVPWGRIFQQELILKRIVGQVHVGLGQCEDLGAGTTTNPGSCLVFAGLTLARVDYTGANILEASSLDQLNPWLQGDTEARRWIWQRTWMLSNANFVNARIAAGEPGWFSFPASNAEYGDIRSGPFLDWKGTLKIPHDQRLVMVMGCDSFQWETGGYEFGAFEPVMSMNLRVLGRYVQRSTTR